MSSKLPTSEVGRDSPPKRKVLSNHFHKSLFLSGNYSDITVECLGGKWKLHKNVLSESSFFQALFDGEWKDSKEEIHKLEVPDEKITQAAMNTCFESIYSCEVQLTEENVIPILAGASYLQLEMLMETCFEFLMETMDRDSAVDYYYAAKAYGGSKYLEETAIEHIKLHLTFELFIKELIKIDTDLMAKIISDPDVVCHDEEIIYCSLVHWLYGRLTSENLGENISKEAINNWKVVSFDYFEQRENPLPFLSTPEGEPFLPVFSKLRMRNLAESLESRIQLLETDRILPTEWIYKAGFDLNLNTIKVFRNPGAPLDITEEFFNANCHRVMVGFDSIESFSEKMTDFLIGIELSCKNSNSKWILTLKRTLGTSFANQFEHLELIARIKVIASNDDFKIVMSASSELKKVSLKLDEEIQLMEFGEEFNGHYVNFILNFLF